VFSVHWPEDFRLTSPAPAVLALLSVTRTDTREVVVLSDEEFKAVTREASEKAAGFTYEG